MPLIPTVTLRKRTYPGGDWTWVLDYRLDGERRREAVGTDTPLAERLRVQFARWLFEGRDPREALAAARTARRAEATTLRAFYPQFVSAHGALQSAGMQDRYRTMFAHVCRDRGDGTLADIPLRDVTRAALQVYMRDRVTIDGVSPTTANREASFVRGMLSRAVDWGLLEFNPVSRVKLYKESPKREVYLTPAQAAALLAALPNETIRSIVECAIYSGLRKNNVLGLRIEDVTFYDLTPGGHVRLQVKGGAYKHVPLSPLACETVRRAAGSRVSGTVFPNPDTGDRYTDVHHTFDRTVRKLGYQVNGTKLRFHDLRHVYATWLHNADVPLDVVQHLLGHAQRSTTERYATFDRPDLMELLSRLPRIRKQQQTI